jgi:hypothetical protein
MRGHAAPAADVLDVPLILKMLIESRCDVTRTFRSISPARRLGSPLRGEKDCCERKNQGISKETQARTGAGAACATSGSHPDYHLHCRVQRLPRALRAIRHGKADHHG